MTAVCDSAVWQAYESGIRGCHWAGAGDRSSA